MLRTSPLRVGDRVKVELLGIPDKMEPMERDVKDDGTINLPYIGDIQASGKKPGELEQDIKAKYEKGWFPNINVAVTPLMGKFIYVMGMVNSSAGGGRIIYSPPMTVLSAIAAAGDFNPFARRTRVQITRANGKDVEYENCVKALKHPELDKQIFPGDRIFVPRRVW